MATKAMRLSRELRDKYHELVGQLNFDDPIDGDEESLSRFIESMSCIRALMNEADDISKLAEIEEEKYDHITGHNVCRECNLVSCDEAYVDYCNDCGAELELFDNLIDDYNEEEK